MTKRVPHINRKPAPWEQQPDQPVRHTMQIDPARKRPPLPMLLWLAVFIAGLIVALAQFAPDGQPAKSASIPNRGQLLLAAAAYASMQAEGDGATVLSQRVVSTKLQPDGTVVAIVRMNVQGVDHRGTAVLRVVLRRSLWRTQSSEVIHTHITH